MNDFYPRGPHCKLCTSKINNARRKQKRKEVVSQIEREIDLIDRDDLIWFTGLFEGEGCLSPTRNGVALYIQMTDEDIIKRAYTVIKVGTIQGPRPHTIPGRKPIWAWQTSNKRDVARVLCAMAPLLGERRRERILELSDRLHYQRDRDFFIKKPQE